ncbi:sensor histidine kinase [Romboutsia weinsteinii]|uniref:histidine kinase n=1 Tax=Romboutsia weinsteinii TaxID=2020949 RepID=A0A371J6I4_9FIRM|nr:HAMP domain-containing sensor histidine kinase [Romboutsia weinsteinii]RDY28400.1 sensor histidine kinase [Romboutsia weinsteinii]
MKFWKKIFLYSVILFIFLFNGTGIILIEKIHNNNLKNTVKSTIDQYSNIESILYLNTDFTSAVNVSTEENLKEWLNIIINGYVINDNLTIPNIEIFTEDNKKLISNSNINVLSEREEVIKAKENDRTFIIRNIDNKRYLFVSSVINLQNIEFKLVLSKDIQPVYNERIGNYEFFLVLDVITLTILAIGMYLISRKLTQPIVKLSNASIEIAKGNYKKRVKEHKSYDEIEVLENNFNAMIDVIESNIKELHYVNESKQRFIDSLNHEIKTPITSIIGYSELLLKGKVNEDTKIKALKYINSEAKRLEVLNSTLLKLILLREKKINSQHIQVRECVLSSYNSLKYKIDINNIDLIINVKDHYIYADKQLIIVLLTNIIDNAIKASNECGKINICGNYDSESLNYVIKIKDEGIGINQEDLDKILEPFYMVDKARTRKNNGIGLGLSICREICELHNIKFIINSQIGKGTEVTLEFEKEMKNDEK